MAKKSPITPLGDKVVIRPLSEDEKAKKTTSGIIVPASAKKNDDKTEYGIVLAVGEGLWNEDGDGRLAPSVNVGDKVLFSTWKETVKIEKEEYFIIPESDILGIIN